MGDIKVMLDEFWSLPTFEERCRRYAQLSDHDKFLVRCSMPPGPEIWIPCNDCKYNLGYAKCEAYPNGLSADHIRAVMADQTIECGDGFHYTPKDERAAEIERADNSGPVREESGDGKDYPDVEDQPKDGAEGEDAWGRRRWRNSGVGS